MRKYIKYEIKGSYKFILGIIAIVLLASIIVQLNIFKEMKFELGMMDSPSDMTGFKAFMMVVSILVIFGAFLTAFFQIIGSFRKELYEDRGYLTFTLPLTGNKILGAKLIVALLWFTVLAVSIVTFNLILAMILYGSEWLGFVKQAFRMVESGAISIGIVSTLSSIMTLILIYFSMALSRVSVRNKKIGGLWFIIFLILNAITGFLVVEISEIFPYFLSMNSLKVLHFYELNGLPNFNVGMGQMIVFGNNFDAYINIMGNLSQIVISVLAFITTGYLIEKKIDL